MRKNNQKWLKLYNDQQDWINRCGSNIAGYVENYGSANDPNRCGDGGEAIYKADIDRLRFFAERAGAKPLPGPR